MAGFLDRIFAKKNTPSERPNPPRIAYGSSAGQHVNEDSAMKVSAYYRGVVYISSQLAKLPWHVKDKQNNLIDDDLSFLLDLTPNPEMSSFSFRLMMIQNAIHHGNSFAEIERDYTGKAVNVWPLPSQNVEVLRTTSGELVYRVVATNSPDPATNIYLPARNVFHLKNFHTKDGIVGQGLVAYAVNTLGISLGADQMASNLFANGGLPSGTLTVPGTLSDEAFERVKASWKDAHAGKQSGKVAVLEEGTKFEPTAFEPEVMQFLESRKFGVLEVARFLGLPPTKLFDTAAATFSNQENSNLEVATDVLDAWAVNLETEADIKILNKRRGGRYSEIDLYAVFRGDMKSRSDYFKSMMQVAAMTPNEIRMREGMAPYADGDRYFVAVNNYSPADRVDEIIDAQVSKGSAPTNANAGVDPVKNFYEAAQKYLERK